MFAYHVSAVTLQMQEKDNAPNSRAGHASNVWIGLDSVHHD